MQSVATVVAVAFAAASFVFFLLWRGKSKQCDALQRENGELRHSNEQLQIEIKQAQERLRAHAEATERAMREKRRGLDRCLADFERVALAGQNDPSVLDALRRDFEQLFEMPEAEATSRGDGT